MTYIKEHSVVDPVEKKMELCSTNVSNGLSEKGAWYFLVMVGNVFISFYFQLTFGLSDLLFLIERLNLFSSMLLFYSSEMYRKMHIIVIK